MKRPTVIRVVALTIGLACIGTLAYALSNARQGYAPRQPIPFSHKRMAGAPDWQVDDKGVRVNLGGFGIPCVYCHTMPYKGRHSTIPSPAQRTIAPGRTAVPAPVAPDAAPRVVTRRNASAGRDLFTARLYRHPPAVAGEMVGFG